MLVADDPADWEGFGIQNSDVELNDMDILNLGDVLCMKKISNWGYTSSFSTTSKDTLKTSEPTKCQYDPKSWYLYLYLPKHDPGWSFIANL